MAATAKENILKKIRKALTTPTLQPFPESGTNGQVFQPAGTDLDITFAESFTKLQGQFSFCFSEAEMVAQIKALATHKQWSKLFCSDESLHEIFRLQQWPPNWHFNLADCNASITFCESLIARTGTMVLSSAASTGRTPSVYAPAHICVAYTHQLVYDIQDGLELIKKKYGKNLPSLISFASGPSRTADIEKTLVTGVHGPKEVYCFLIEG
jgi:L-lactate dehydrogenase complex protein LldG